MKSVLQIVTLMLDDVNQRLSHNDIHLDVTDKVKEKLVDLGYDPKMGARPLRRTIQDYIEDAITDYYLENPSEKDETPCVHRTHRQSPIFSLPSSSLTS